MTKTLTVATAVQKAVLEEVLMPEIAVGFWKNARPADHADAWKGLEIVVGTDLGPNGFEVPRNYNFVNPEFFRKAESKLMTAALEVNPDLTVKQLKKQLIALNQILGARLKEVGGTITKLPRGRKAPTEASVPAATKTTAGSKATVRKAAVLFAPAETAEA